jgi:hypothetical protein
MQDNDENPLKRMDYGAPKPESVREPAAPALVMQRAGPHERSVTADPAVADARDESPIETSGIREEGRTEGDGVEHEALEARDGTRIDQPFDPTRIKISTREPSVDIVMERIRQDEIDLAPDFQRSGDIWPVRTQSRLIESILLRIPLPVFYMAADPDDNWQVVDGLQRLGTLRNFILHKKLRLRGLEYLSQFEGHDYDQLPRAMQRRITETQLSCHIIETGTPPEVMFNVFKRINTAGKPLVGQEIRHALNPGPARELLRDLAGSPEFRKATDGTVNPKRMADRECVLRFLAFRSLGDESYGGKLDEFLMNAMKHLNRTQGSHSSLWDDFQRAMSLAWDLFGKEAFRKPNRPGYKRWRSPVNKPLFESLSVALAEVPEGRSQRLRDRKREVAADLSSLMEDAEFFESISVGTQTARQVKVRFGRMRELVREGCRD